MKTSGPAGHIVVSPLNEENELLAHSRRALRRIRLLAVPALAVGWLLVYLRFGMLPLVIVVALTGVLMVSGRVLDNRIPAEKRAREGVWSSHFPRISVERHGSTRFYSAVILALRGSGVVVQRLQTSRLGRVSYEVVEDIPWQAITTIGMLPHGSDGYRPLFTGTDVAVATATPVDAGFTDALRTLGASIVL